MPNIDRPNGESVSRLHEQLIRDWTPRLRLDDEFRDLIRGANVIETLDPTYERNMDPIEIHAGRSGGIIEHANGLLQASPSFHVEPLSLNTKDMREAERVERAAAHIFIEQLLANDFWPAVGRDVLSYGRAFIKALTLDSEWTAQAGYPVREEEEDPQEYLDRVEKWKDSEAKFPFVITHISPLDILPMLDGKDNVLASIEEKFITAKILADDMGSDEVRQLIENGSINWYDQLPVVEYIDEQWIGYFLTGTDPRQRAEDELRNFTHIKRAYSELRVWEHGMGKHPVILVSGIRTSDPEYLYRWKSFLSDGKDSLELYDFLLSRLTTMVWAYYLPSYTWRLAATTASFRGRDRPMMKVNLGGVTTLYADEELLPLAVNQDLPDAITLLQQTDDMIQRHTLEDVLFGRVQGSAPAFQVNLRINVAKSKLTPIAQHMAGGITQVMSLLLRGVEHLGESVKIGGIDITTGIAKRYRDRITASIEPKSPVDRNQDIGVANMALDFGLPWDWIAENILDIEDPATLRLMKDIRAIEESEPFRQRLLQDALEQLEVLVEEEDFIGEDEIALQDFPPEFQEALARLRGEANGELPAPAASQLGAPGAEAAPEDGGNSLGRGPFPDGASPQSIQGGRGLNTLNEPPPNLSAGAAQVGTENIIPGG